MRTHKIVWGMVLGLTITQVYSQSRLYSNTALQLSGITQNGTARFQGVGGNHAALGGDASNIFGNPAGIAFSIVPKSASALRITASATNPLTLMASKKIKKSTLIFPSFR